MRITQWNEKFSTKETNEILKELASVHVRRINDATAREHIATSLASDAFLDLCNYNPAYAQLSASDAYNVRQVCAFFQKRADLDVGIDKRRAAVEAFIAAEKLCFETNVICEQRREGKFKHFPHVESVFYSAQRKIARILGDVPSLEELKLRFGPGATTQVQKRMASSKRKLGQTFACSEDLVPHVNAVLEEVPHWVFTGYPEDLERLSVPVEIHDGRLDFVPKNFKADRSVVIEPALNTMVQAGFGDYISGRLKKFGVDLRDQTLNQRMALEGSLTGELATLDLSSASDTIAIELVFDLLPIDWALELAKYRSGIIVYKGVRVKLQKFSSMGNGFTFPLESLIFYALASACVPEDRQHQVTVYGDDIIVPSNCYELLTEVLVAAGFVPNLAKSFSSGPFRESCGADYLRGINIRPSYVKEPLAGYDLFRLHNQYVRRGDEELASIILNYIDKPLRKWGPDGYGDGHLIGDYDRVPHGRERGWSGHVFETYTFKAKKDFSVLPGDRIYPAYSSYTRSVGSHEPPDVLDTLRKGKSTGIPERIHLTEPVKVPCHMYNKRGRLGVSTPGRDTVNLIKIYVLCN